MLVNKGLAELINYSLVVGDLIIKPIRLAADDVNFEVEFEVSKEGRKPISCYRRGRHKDFVFSTSIQNIPFTINVDGVMKKVRLR